MTEKQLLAEAANTLINDNKAPEMFKTLLDVMGLPPTLPVKLSGEASVLNPLLTMARRDREAFNRVIDLIESKRASREMSPLRQPETETKFDKNEYQRELMADRRVRQIKALDIENLRRPPSSQLIGHPRMEFMRVQQGKWTDQLETLLAAHKTGKTMTKAKRQEISAQFWQGIDLQLEETEAAVYRWIQTGRKGEAP